MSNNIEIINRKASFNYEFVDTYVAGIVLEGFEIVAIKNGQINISEAYCYFSGNELFLKNADYLILPCISFHKKNLEQNFGSEIIFGFLRWRMSVYFHNGN